MTRKLSTNTTTSKATILGTECLRSRYSCFFFRSASALLLVCAPLLTSCSSSSKSGKGLKSGGSELSEDSLNAARDARFGSGNIPLAEGNGPFQDVLFAYDSSTVSSEARSTIESNFELLKQNSSLTVQLEGHCDERGTEEYNLTLGEARAAAVKDQLISLGLDPSRITTISYGENVPLDQGHDESAYARNRRVHFSGMGKTASNGSMGNAAGNNARARLAAGSDNFGGDPFAADASGDLNSADSESYPSETLNESDSSYSEETSNY
jgi:peptidoglycan-associated lipoprotein